MYRPAPSVGSPGPENGWPSAGNPCPTGSAKVPAGLRRGRACGKGAGKIEVTQAALEALNNSTVPTARFPGLSKGLFICKVELHRGRQQHRESHHQHPGSLPRWL